MCDITVIARSSQQPSWTQIAMKPQTHRHAWLLPSVANQTSSFLQMLAKAMKIHLFLIDAVRILFWLWDTEEDVTVPGILK